MALGSTQPPTEMSTRNLPGGKGLLCGVYIFGMLLLSRVGGTRDENDGF
jgi:hypothetical protein